MKRKLLAFLVILVFSMLMIIPQATSAQTTTSLRLVPSKTMVSSGEVFTLAVYVDPAPASNVAGVQFNLAFNANALSVNSVTEGTFLKQGTTSTYFMAGTIDNVAGTLVNVVDVITTPGASTSTTGLLATISCTAKTPGQSSNFAFSSVIVGNKDGVAVPLGAPNITQVVVTQLYDVNSDGLVNVSDLIIIGQAIGTTGAPGWRKEDINKDGVVSILDMILVGQHFS